MQLDPCFSNRLKIFVITTRSILKVCLWKNRNAYISNLNARIVDSFWSDKMSRKDTREGQPLLFPEGTQSIFHRFFFFSFFLIHCLHFICILLSLSTIQILFDYI